MKLPRSIFMGVIPILFLSIFAEGVFAATTQGSAATVKFTQSVDPGSQLTLDSVPTLDFGTKTVSLNDEIYENIASAPIVQVTDERSFSQATGWKVTVSASKFTTTAPDPVRTLDGAVINFSNGVASQVPDLGFGAPAPETPINITTDGTLTTANVVSAASGEGRGTWQTSWLNNNVTLSVPGGHMDPDMVYTSNLIWTLENTP